MMRSHRLPGVLPILVGIVLFVFSTGCGHEKDHLVLNEPPSVQITGGPLAGSLAAYTVKVFWRGWDSDGIIDHFEYAIDPPFEAFTDTMVGYPQRFADISIRVLPGPSNRQDTLVVSRVVDGKTYSFRWIETIESSRSFAFVTPEADTVSAGSTRLPSDTFSGLHAVYLRAVDDDGEYSKFDRIGYRAFTITPKATITKPNINLPAGGWLMVGPTITVQWDGLDVDSPEARKKPTGYVYKLLRLDTLVPQIPIQTVMDPGILYRKGDPTWTYQRADTLHKTFFLVPGYYVFGIRAVDVAGAVEPFLEFGRNAFKFQALPNGGSPNLTIIEPSLGIFRDIRAPAQVESPVGSHLRFTWSASAEVYGGSIEGYSWGIDIPDVEREGPSSGWSGWGPILGNFQPIVFAKPGIHVLYVRARDTSGAVTMGMVIIKVLDFPLDREVLWVDDVHDGVHPRDFEHDEFWLSLFRDSNKFDMERDWFRFDSFGPGETRQSADRLLLEDMGRYKLIVWDCLGNSGDVSGTALFDATSRSRKLGAYLSAGGKLWISGGLTVPAMLAPGGIANFEYPKDVKSDTSGFAFQFMKLASGAINGNNGKNQKKDNEMTGVKPFPNRPAYYGTMEYDGNWLYPDGLKGRSPTGSIPHTEVIVEPIYAQDAKFSGVIDSLYVYQAVKSSSSYNNKLNAIRWHDPDPARRHGRTQWFGFEMYYLKKDQAQETFNRVIDWFREEQPPNANP